MLFNIYVQCIFQLEVDQQIGIKVNGRPIDNIRYVEYTTILADNLEDPQTHVNYLPKMSLRLNL